MFQTSLDCPPRVHVGACTHAIFKMEKIFRFVGAQILNFYFYGCTFCVASIANGNARALAIISVIGKHKHINLFYKKNQTPPYYNTYVVNTDDSEMDARSSLFFIFLVHTSVSLSIRRKTDLWVHIHNVFTFVGAHSQKFHICRCA